MRAGESTSDAGSASYVVRLEELSGRWRRVTGTCPPTTTWNIVASEAPPVRAGSRVTRYVVAWPWGPGARACANGRLHTAPCPPTKAKNSPFRATRPWIR